MENAHSGSFLVRQGEIFSDADGMARGDSLLWGERVGGGGGCAQRECDRYTGERRRGQNVRRCAPCESQEVNQILPGCTHYLSSLEKGQREKERQRIQD